MRRSMGRMNIVYRVCQVAAIGLMAAGFALAKVWPGVIVALTLVLLGWIGQSSKMGWDPNSLLIPLHGDCRCRNLAWCHTSFADRRCHHRVGVLGMAGSGSAPVSQVRLAGHRRIQAGSIEIAGCHHRFEYPDRRGGIVPEFPASICYPIFAGRAGHLLLFPPLPFIQGHTRKLNSFLYRSMATFHNKATNANQSCHNDSAGVGQDPPAQRRNDYAADW